MQPSFLTPYLCSWCYVMQPSFLTPYLCSWCYVMQPSFLTPYQTIQRKVHRIAVRDNPFLTLFLPGLGWPLVVFFESDRLLLLCDHLWIVRKPNLPKVSTTQICIRYSMNKCLRESKTSTQILNFVSPVFTNQILNFVSPVFTNQILNFVSPVFTNQILNFVSPVFTNQILSPVFTNQILNFVSPVFTNQILNFVSPVFTNQILNFVSPVFTTQMIGERANRPSVREDVEWPLPVVYQILTQMIKTWPPCLQLTILAYLHVFIFC